MKYRFVGKWAAYREWKGLVIFVFRKNKLFKLGVCVDRFDAMKMTAFFAARCQNDLYNGMEKYCIPKNRVKLTKAGFKTSNDCEFLWVNPEKRLFNSSKWRKKK